jgi:hypothetical protein
MVPPSYVFSRFLKRLFNYQNEIDLIFANLVEKIGELLPDFGKRLALDSKALSSHAAARKNSETTIKQDGRRDLDADFGAKTYRGTNEDGTAWEKVKSWFGYKIHLLVDSTYELPLTYTLTKASLHDSPEAHNILKKAMEDHPQIFGRCDFLAADKGYDDVKLLIELWDKHQIKPIIDIRNTWKDGEPTKLLPGQTNITYDYKGGVTCHCPKTGEDRKMAFGGFEQDRSALKYVCPAQAYGIDCAGCADCPIKHSVRIPMNTNRRIFTPIARSSYKWEQLYKTRTAVERVNSRLDVSFGFEEHYIRGMKKMTFRCGLALCVMLAMALGRIRQGHADLMRSLVKAKAA